MNICWPYPYFQTKLTRLAIFLGLPSELLSFISNTTEKENMKSQLCHKAETPEIRQRKPLLSPDTDKTKFKEEKEVGVIKKNVYFMYWKAIGSCLGIFILMAIILMQVSRNGVDVGLIFWLSLGYDDVNYFIIVFASLTAVTSLFTLFRAFLFAYGGVLGAKKLHKYMLQSVLNVSEHRGHPFNFYFSRCVWDVGL